MHIVRACDRVMSNEVVRVTVFVLTRCAWIVSIGTRVLLV